ncbi:MAG: caspase family protein, partial [Myxococcales bacterium]|nr:caspase family protein [Myxococcales bacterium]
MIATLLLTALAAVSAPSDRAIFIGVDAGSIDKPMLTQASQDAQRAAAVFRRRGALPPRAFELLLADDRAGAQAVFHRLPEAFQRVPIGVRRLTVYFAGHGADRHLEFGPNRLAIDTLLALARARQPQELVFIIDACNTTDDPVTARGGLRPDQVEDLTGRRFVEAQPGEYLMFGAELGQAAYEHPQDGGYLTQSLVAGLDGLADQDADTNITFSELCMWVSAKVAWATSGLPHHGFQQAGCEQAQGARPTRLVVGRWDGAMGQITLPDDIAGVEQIVVHRTAPHPMTMQLSLEREHALPAGRWQGRATRLDTVHETDFTVEIGQATVLPSLAQWSSETAEQVAARGWAEAIDANRLEGTNGWWLGARYGVALAWLDPVLIHRLVMDVDRQVGHWAFSVDAGYGWAPEARGGAGAHEASLLAGARWHPAPWATLDVSLGGSTGARWASWQAPGA